MGRTFTDSLGRVWQIALDPWLLTHIKNETTQMCRACRGTGQNGQGPCPTCHGDTEVGVLLTDWADDEWKLAGQLAADPSKLCDVLWAICEEQAEKNGVANAREFARGMAGTALVNAYTALGGAVADFGRNPAEREALEMAMAKAMQIAELTSQGMVERMRERMAKIDVNQMAQNFIDSVSSTPPSPELTPSAAELPLDN